MHYSHGSALISDLLRRSLSTTMLFSRVLRRASYDSNGRAPSSSATSAHSERSLKAALALPYRQFMESRVPNTMRGLRMLCWKEWCRTSTTPSHKRVRTSCFTSSVPEREKTYISSLNEVECGEDGESIKQPRYLRTATSHMTTRHSQT